MLKESVLHVLLVFGVKIGYFIACLIPQLTGFIMYNDYLSLRQVCFLLFKINNTIYQTYDIGVSIVTKSYQI